ncbi:MAG: 4Fe-4S dicluster domain-containing protein [Thiotrichales bacterium]
MQFLPSVELGRLIEVLREQGFKCLGSVVREGAVVYAEIASASELAVGVSDRQRPGEYRLTRSDRLRYFDWAAPAQSLKPLLFKPREDLWRCVRDADGTLEFTEAKPEPAMRAVIGVRACDLAALALNDRHFLGNLRDPYYAAQRRALFTVAVHCTRPAETCFCASTGDGPHADAGFDLALHELDEGFLVEVGSLAGEAVAAALPLEDASPEQIRRAANELRDATEMQHRALPGRDLRESLLARQEHPRWDQVAARCLACGNCTSVCPTCFCHADEETAELDGEISRHERVWDSCFTQGHSYIHGIVIRADTRLRYRQWLTHKLGTWHDQYGRSGCTGCGRCITWCPVGIDLTEEAHELLK